MTTIRTMLIALALAGWTGSEHAADTTRVGANAPRPAARIADLAWLAGRWEGSGIDGGAATEVYSPPAGGQIVGHFRQLRPDGSVMFYELMTITEVGETLHYRLKHFNPGLNGWEEKDEVVSFPLVAATGDAWLFIGLAIRRDGSNGMTATVRARDNDGKEHDLVFRYRRAVIDDRR